MTPMDVKAAWRAYDQHALEHARTCELKVDPVDLGNPSASYADVTFVSPDGQPVHVRAIMPTSVGPHPTVLMFHDATRGLRGWHHMTRFVALGYAVLALESRPGVQGVLVQEPLTVGDGLGIAMRVQGQQPPLMGRVLDEQTADAVRKTYKDALALAHVAHCITGVDPTRLVGWGEGLGGGIALVAAAVAGLAGACVLNPMPAALDDSCAMVDVACISHGCACPVLMGTCLLDLQATPKAQYAVARGLLDVRQITYPHYAHERVNAFEDEMVPFLIGLASQTA